MCCTYTIIGILNNKRIFRQYIQLSAGFHKNIRCRFTPFNHISANNDTKIIQKTSICQLLFYSLTIC